MTDTTTNPATALADYRLRVWRFAREQYWDRGLDLNDAMRELGLPDVVGYSSDVDEVDVDEAVGRIRAAAATAADPAAALAEFRVQVRRIAIQVAEDNDYCAYGLNTALTELNLPGWYGLAGTVTATVRLVDTAEHRPAPLTPATLTPLLRAESDDSDITITAALAVTKVEHVLGGELVATVAVPVAVSDTTDRGEAQDWIEHYVTVLPYAEPVQLTHAGGQGYYLGGAATIAWADAAQPATA
jgi:hypothetical protein